MSLFECLIKKCVEFRWEKGCVCIASCAELDQRSLSFEGKIIDSLFFSLPSLCFITYVRGDEIQDNKYIFIDMYKVYLFKTCFNPKYIIAGV